MGYYITCEICDRRDKYHLACDCYDKFNEQYALDSIGYVIVDAFIHYNSCFKGIVQKLQKKDTYKYSITWFAGGDGEYSISKSIEIINEQKYLEYKQTSNKHI